MTQKTLTELNNIINAHIRQCAENMLPALPEGYHGQVVVNIADGKLTTFKKSETVKSTCQGSSTGEPQKTPKS